MSFVVLRKKEPNLVRPYKVKHYKFVGITATILSGLMVILYLIPGSGCSMTKEEWIIVGGWTLLGVFFYVICKIKYKRRFGQINSLG